MRCQLYDSDPDVNCKFAESSCEWSGIEDAIQIGCNHIDYLQATIVIEPTLVEYFIIVVEPLDMGLCPK